MLTNLLYLQYFIYNTNNSTIYNFLVKKLIITNKLKIVLQRFCPLVR